MVDSHRHPPEVSGDQQSSAVRSAVQQSRLDEALLRNGGGRAWRAWKAGQLEEVMQDLAFASPRIELLHIELTGDLKLVYGVEMPVPLAPTNGVLELANAAVFRLAFRESWTWESPPGWGPLSVLAPQPIWHPNVAPDLKGVICLGALPPNTNLKEIILLGYYTLTLQETTLDELDPAGVLNSAACDYYRSHPEYLPLCGEGLLEPWAGLQEIRRRLDL